MREIEKELYCRVGLAYDTGRLFIRKLYGLDGEIAYEVCDMLKITPSKLHELTCAVKETDKISITGDKYLADKVLRLKLRVIIEECELIDDMEQKPVNS